MGHSFLEHLEISPGVISIGWSEALMDMQADPLSNFHWKAGQRARDQ
jgi:hypothetical protein